MKRQRTLFLVFLFGVLLSVIPRAVAAQPKQVYVVQIEDAITPAVADVIRKAVARASESRGECLVIRMDTPGGLDLSMRDIVKDLLNADIPVIVYIAPSGARAASAGVFITLAADIAAMAPGTNIGAAHPVAVGGGQMDRKMKEKILNDAVAYIRSLAEKKGRNADWAERAVIENDSLPETEALNKKVIDLVATDLDDLLKKIHGRTVEKAGGKFKLATRGLPVKVLEMGFREKFLSILSNPTIAYLLMMAGLIGIYFELANPGAIFPGVLGGVCLILAFFSFRLLPVNYAGVLLILLGGFLFLAEIKVTSYGLLSMGGIVSLTLGSIMLFESPLPALRASLAVILPTVLFISLFFLFAMGAALKAQMAKPVCGPEGLVGRAGVCRVRIAPEGKIFVAGEIWDAWAEERVEEGEKVRILQVEGMRVKVEKLS